MEGNWGAYRSLCLIEMETTTKLGSRNERKRANQPEKVYRIKVEEPLSILSLFAGYLFEPVLSKF